MVKHEMIHVFVCYLGDVENVHSLEEVRKEGLKIEQEKREKLFIGRKKRRKEGREGKIQGRENGWVR